MRLFHAHHRSRFRSTIRQLYCEDLETRTLLAADALAAEVAMAEGEDTNQVADFSLIDVNPNSTTRDQNISPRDFQGQISAWYFGHAT